MTTLITAAKETKGRVAKLIFQTDGARSKEFICLFREAITIICKRAIKFQT